jgi:apolipoprotein N-acyltransferase
MTPATRIALGCALACSSAVLLTLSFAPYDAWFFIWVGFVPMAVAGQRILPGRLAALAPALGVGGFIAGTFGGIFPGSAAWYMKMLPLLVGGAVFFGSLGDRERRQRAGHAAWPLEMATGWVAVELVRLFVPVLGTWGFLGYAMYRQTWFIQPVACVGMFGLDALIVVTNYSVALLVIALLDRRRLAEGQRAVPLRLALGWCAGAAVAGAVWSASSLSMRQRPVGATGATVRVAALQPGRRPWQVGSTPAARDRGMLALLSTQTRRAATEGARVIVWPEAALSSDPELAYRDELANLAKEVGAYLFVGYHVATPAGTRNEVVTIGSDGSFLGTFGKDHPVVFLGETSISRGTYPTYQTPLGTLGAIICYDMDFTDTARELARRGAQIIAVPSADWPAIAAKHYVHSVFRALETGAAVAKSEFSRDSAIVDASGTILASSVTPDGSAAVLVADVTLRSGVPLAARWGDWVGWLCMGALVARRVARLRTRLSST